jgi:hypothetical protein
VRAADQSAAVTQKHGEHGLAAQIGKPHRPPVQIGQLERRRRIADGERFLRQVPPGCQHLVDSMSANRVIVAFAVVFLLGFRSPGFDARFSERDSRSTESISDRGGRTVDGNNRGSD